MSKHSRGFTISSSRETRASREAVMHRVSHPETWPDWVPEILHMEDGGLVAAGDEVEGLAEMLGFRVDGRSRITEVSPRHLVQDVVIGVRMIARYAVETTPSGTVITHELLVTRPEGLMGAVLSFFLRYRLKAMQKRLLANLAQRSETGSGSSSATEGGATGRNGTFRDE